jgi:ketosteroid isomerase-like protein
MSTEPLVIAKELSKAIESADVASLERLYASTGVVWHNTDSLEMKVADVLDLVSAIGRVSTCRVTVHSTLVTAEGFVQTQNNTYSFQDGSTTSFHAALVATLDGEGRISRLEEYLDSVGLAPLTAKLGV